MPTVATVPFVPFWGHDANANPLAGGKFFAFRAGTDTPQDTYNDPGGMTLNPHPVLLDSAGYANIYLLAGAFYKLRLLSATDVQQWEVDQVFGVGPGGAQSTAPITLNAVPGPAPLVAVAAWQPGWREIGVTAEVTVAFGTSGGLQQLAIGDSVQFDRWGYAALTLGATTNATNFLTGDSPWVTTFKDVVVTPIGGSFDGAGQLQLTLHYTTL